MSIQIQTARKDHICDECLRKIPKGDKYWRKQDDESFFVIREHTNCEEYRDSKFDTWQDDNEKLRKINFGVVT